jgi:hypothetical protein
MNGSRSLAQSTIRRVDVDWLRVLAVLLVPFHAARLFNIGEAFYTKNAELSDPLSTFIAFVNPWHMPLLFVLAGASTYLALGRRTGTEYLRERVQRFVRAARPDRPPERLQGSRPKASPDTRQPSCHHRSRD